MVNFAKRLQVLEAVGTAVAHAEEVFTALHTQDLLAGEAKVAAPARALDRRSPAPTAAKSRSGWCSDPVRAASNLIAPEYNFARHDSILCPWRDTPFEPRRSGELETLLLE